LSFQKRFFNNGVETPDVIRNLLARLRARARSFWKLEDPEERIEGSGEAYLDPAYNSRYEAERELQEQATLDAEVDDEVRSPPDDGGHPPDDRRR
jgi:hypothetical protein